MVKKLTSGLLLALAIAPANAQRMLDIASGTFSPTLESPKVERTIVPTDNGYKVTYSFNKALLLPDDLFPSCELWKLDGFSANNMPEEPAYPYASDSFTVPAGHSAQVSLINQEWVEVKSEPAPARQPLLLSDTEGYTVDNVLPVKSTSEWMPSQMVTDNGTRPYKNVGIINIGITPVQFNLASGNARICKTLEYEVTFTPQATTMTLANESESATDLYFDDPYLSNATLNWEWEKEQSSVAPLAAGIQLPNVLHPPKEYLIISATAYKSAVEEFAKWKRTLGFNVTTKYQNTWKQEEIIDEILACENISYLLFIGNNSQIPGDQIVYSIEGENTTTLTDISYANYNPDEIIPEFSYGRLPVNSLTEAKRVLDRIITYEKNPSHSDTFYNSNLFITQFLGNKTSATARNSQTTYEISKYMEKIHRSISREFGAYPEQTPLFWSDAGIGEDGLVVNPCPIPLELRKPTFDWSASTNSIISEINKGYSQVFYFGHGQPSGWERPTLSSNNVANLSNGKNLPFVFSMACQTGDYSFNGSFCEKFLTAPNGGAIGLFGFTNSTLTAYTDVLATAFYNCMFPTPGIYPLINDRFDEISLAPTPSEIQTSELGLLHRLAITKMVNTFPSSQKSKEYQAYEASMLTLFGDPSMNVHLAQPKSIVPTATQLGRERSISVSEKALTITTYDGKTNQIMNYKGNANFTIPADASEFVMCIHGPGYKPYIVNFPKVAKSSSNKKNQVVKEGRIWRYYSYLNGKMNPVHDIYLDLCFSGTTEIDGKEYYNCYVWKESDDFSQETACLIAYMREENGKIYARYIPDAKKNSKKKGIDIIPYAPMMASYSHDINELSKKDVLLYDNSLKEGDILYSTGEIDGSDRFFVKESSEVECFGVTRKVWHLKKNNNLNETYDYYEGIGDVIGLLPMPGAVPITYDSDFWSLVEVIDENGNPLFVPSKMTTGVENVGEDMEVVKEAFYDLNGVEINRPVSNGVYVKTQTLSNGATRTEKVMVK